MFYEKLRSGNKEILLIGSSHSDEKEYVSKIKNYFLDFNPDIVLVEGNFDIPEFSSEEDAVARGKDMGFVNYLSKFNDVPIYSNDPSFSSDINFVEDIYGKDVAFLYFFLRCHKYTDSFNLIDKIKSCVSWPDYDFSMENVKVLFNKIFDFEIDLERDYSSFFDPTLHENKFNDVSRKLNIFRDDYMINKLREIICDYDKIFIIKGDYHITTNMDRFRAVLNEI